MDYYADLKLHYHPKKGWVNDPNGLVYFDGYYHLFYQHAPNSEVPFSVPMHWGHARTKDFIHWEELPVALYPDMPYDDDGCWSGTAAVKDGRLYLFYASVHKIQIKTETQPEIRVESVSVAYSDDGINFTKYEGNPVIPGYPEDGSSDFRDPAVTCINGKYYCVMATAFPAKQLGRLLIYESEDLFNWTYGGIMCEWENSRYAECPSFMEAEDGKYLLTASVVSVSGKETFAVMYGSFNDGVFGIEVSQVVDKGPDQYAGQVFRDPKGRNLMITWMPGWSYARKFDRDIGTFTVPREMKLVGGKVYAYPVEELQCYLKDSDEALRLTEDGFIIERQGRAPVVYEGEIRELKVLRDVCYLEVFVNGGEEVFTVLL